MKCELCGGKNARLQRITPIVSLGASNPTQEDVDATWLAEVKRRHDEMERGNVQTIPYEEAMRRVRDELKEMRKNSA